MNHCVYWIWIQLVLGVGNQKLVTLLKHFQDGKDIFEHKNSEIVKQILSKHELEKCEQITLEDGDRLRRNTLELGVQVICYDCEEYPESLKHIYNPPCVLYATKNAVECLQGLCIGVVGSRKMSYYGLEVTKFFCKDLVEAGVVVISGLAYGADTQAHKTAVEYEGKTLGVLGCGIDITYPAANKNLRKLMEQKGGTITEFPLGTAPYGANFPIRNRIISGLSKGVLVVEAGEKSGTLITAKYALEDGKDVFAVPCNIFSQTTQGTNRLIQNYAKLVTSAKDILDEYGYEIVVQKTQKEETYTLQKQEKIVLDTLSYTPKHIDMIVAETGESVEMVSGILFQLEIYDFIDSHVGKTYSRRL